jgi:prepilin-type N-terminal cleavage/methylation domain-containing protein
MHRRAFTLIELLVVIAILAILAAILYPVFAQARDAARQAVTVSNIRQAAMAAMMYMGDFDGRIPRLDNNGSCRYGENPCATPDWGNATNDPRDPDARPMFLNACQPYMRNYDALYGGVVGKTRWREATRHTPYGLNWGGPYDPTRHDVYYGIVGYFAVNINLVEIWGIESDMSRVARPSEIVLIAESVWDETYGPQFGVGNTGVWPYMPGSRCFRGYGFGWTWYVNRAPRRSGTLADLTRGFATVAFTDGSVRTARHASLERCVFLPSNTGDPRNPGVWIYPFWDPRF